MKLSVPAMREWWDDLPKTEIALAAVAIAVTILASLATIYDWWPNWLPPVQRRQR